MNTIKLFAINSKIKKDIRIYHYEYNQLLKRINVDDFFDFVVQLVNTSTIDINLLTEILYNYFLYKRHANSISDIRQLEKTEKQYFVKLVSSLKKQIQESDILDFQPFAISLIVYGFNETDQAFLQIIKQKIFDYINANEGEGIVNLLECLKREISIDNSDIFAMDFFHSDSIILDKQIIEILTSKLYVIKNDSEIMKNPRYIHDFSEINFIGEQKSQHIVKYTLDILEKTANFVPTSVDE